MLRDVTTCWDLFEKWSIQVWISSDIWDIDHQQNIKHQNFIHDFGLRQVSVNSEHPLNVCRLHYVCDKTKNHHIFFLLEKLSKPICLSNVELQVLFSNHSGIQTRPSKIVTVGVQLQGQILYLISSQLSGLRGQMISHYYRQWCKCWASNMFI
jgi:hypothetical protein